MAKTRLKNWPKGIKAGQLQWIGSPQRVGEERQWVSKLAFSFLSTDGQPRDSTFIVKAPWGMLPALRVGNIYREGVPGKRNRDERTVTAVVDTGLEVIAAREVPSSICKASTSFRASESCLRFQASSFQYYLPCCEIIRTLLGPNTWLANALMDPELLNEMIYGETHHGNASLVMSNVLPTSFAQAPLLQQLALLRLDAEWNNAFRQVFHDRQSIGVRTGRMEEVLSPLSLVPTFLRGATVTFRARLDAAKRVGFVRRIEAVSFAVPYPFAEVCCHHPKIDLGRLEERKVAGGYGSDGQSPRGQDDGEQEECDKAVGTDSRSSSTHGGSHLVDSTVVAFQSTPTLLHASKPRRRRVRDDSSPPHKTASARQPTGEPVEVSAGDRGDGPGSKSIAFQGSSLPLGWPKAFIQMVNAFGLLSDRYPSIETEFRTAAVDLEGLKWRYLLVSVKSPRLHAYVLEMEEKPSSTERHWTMIFTVHQDLEPHVAANGLLESAFNPKGGWIRSKLKVSDDIPGIGQLAICPHSEDGSPSAFRVYHKLRSWAALRSESGLGTYVHD